MNRNSKKDVQLGYFIKNLFALNSYSLITDCSDFDKLCSGAQIVPFLFYYYCNAENMI